MSIESNLTRQLGIRFIDARTIVNEAKINLGIHGYVSDKSDEVKLQDEARRIYMDRPFKARRTMKRLSSSLEAAKSIDSSSSSVSSSSCWDYGDGVSNSIRTDASDVFSCCDSIGPDSKTASPTIHSNRKLLWRLQRKNKV